MKKRFPQKNHKLPKFTQDEKEPDLSYNYERN